MSKPYNSNIKHEKSLLEQCAPNPEAFEEKVPSQIKRPLRDTAFTLTGQRVEIACIIEPLNDTSGRYAGERFHPVDAAVQHKISIPVRRVAFHGALSQTSENFILAQKLSSAHKPYCTWATSMALALETPAGVFVRLSSDRDNGRYVFETVDLPAPVSLNWPEFNAVLQAELADNIIDSVDAAVLKRLGQSKPRSQNGWDGVQYVI
jgi:hypothetical protein